MFDLREQPTEPFLATPALFPFAVLTQATDKTQILRQVAQKIEQIPEQRIQGNIAGSTFVLAGLLLDSETIQRILRRDIMQESSTYRMLVEEGEERERQRVVLNLLREGIEIDIISRVTGLSVEEIKQIQANQEQN